MKLKLFLLLIISIFLSACDFHLRGNYDLPAQLQNIYVDYTQPNDALVQGLKRALRRAKVNVVNQVSQADYILQIKSITQNPVLQATSTTGQVNTYAMQYTVKFSLQDKTGKDLLANQQVQSSEYYTIASSQLATNFNQQPNLTPALQQDVINQIMFRLGSKNTENILATS